MELGTCLEPLAPLKTKINVINGLFNKHATGVGIHPGQTGNILSGASLQKGAELQGRHQHRPGAGQHIGRGDGAAEHGAGLRAADHRLPRDELLDGLQLAHLLAERDLAGADGGLSRRWPSTACSTTAAAGATRASSTASRSEAAGLSRQVSRGDKAKLDEYLTSVREVEKRVDAMRAAKQTADERAERPGPARRHDAAARQRPARRHPRAHAADVRHRRPRLPDRQDARRHAAALPRHLRPVLSVPRRPRRPTTPPRTTTCPTPTSGSRATTCSQLAYLAGRLDAMPEGDGTVLDNSCLLFLSNMWSGSKHDTTKVPVLLAGGLGGTLETGRVLDYPDKGDDNRKLCSLYLSIMDRMGVKLDRFGDADTRLAGF